LHPYAIVLTFFCVGLRVSELCGLTLQETDLARGSTWIKGKGRTEKELVPLPAAVVNAIRAYLTYRGTVPGPLFQTRGQRGKHRNGALETRSVLRIVRELGQRVGLHVWCHALRHSSITAALDVAAKAGIGLDKVKAHSRHAAIGTLLIYADEHDRQGTQRTLADLVARTLTS
jgi:integrase/recombinase XerC